MQTELCPLCTAFGPEWCVCACHERAHAAHLPDEERDRRLAARAAMLATGCGACDADKGAPRHGGMHDNPKSAALCDCRCHIGALAAVLDDEDLRLKALAEERERYAGVLREAHR